VQQELKQAGSLEQVTLKGEAMRVRIGEFYMDNNDCIFLVTSIDPDAHKSVIAKMVGCLRGEAVPENTYVTYHINGRYSNDRDAQSLNDLAYMIELRSLGEQS
jgi:hypothetical protein